MSRQERWIFLDPEPRTDGSSTGTVVDRFEQPDGFFSVISQACWLDAENRVVGKLEEIKSATSYTEPASLERAVLLTADLVKEGLILVGHTGWVGAPVQN